MNDFQNKLLNNLLNFFSQDDKARLQKQKEEQKALKELAAKAAKGPLGTTVDCKFDSPILITVRFLRRWWWHQEIRKEVNVLPRTIFIFKCIYNNDGNKD